MTYNPKQVEDTWREDVLKPFQESSGMEHFYVLEMFPYPSGVLHVGHIRNYTIGDTIARFKSLQGLNVLHPMGFDAFGLPAENAAIHNGGKHPEVWTRDNIKKFHSTFTRFGMGYDWKKKVVTCDADYICIQQELFGVMYRSGLVYQAETMVNWDPVDQTVLANEQVLQDGKGWRSGATVERRLMTQWFFRITKYADELLNMSELAAWPEKVRSMQTNWIGRTEGLLVDLISADDSFTLQAFTNQPELLAGATFVGVGPEHAILQRSLYQAELEAFRQKCRQRGTSSVVIEKGEKEGVHTGLFVTHPLTGKALPLFAINFLLPEREMHAYMGIPAHDAASFQLASNMGLEIIRVVKADDVPYTPKAEDTHINSGQYNGMACATARTAIRTALQEGNQAKPEVLYRLRDWGVSRQRYWGNPIPVIHCEDCGPVLVPRKDLPVLLPQNVVIDGRGNPLQKHPHWKHVACPECGKPALRETDTMDTFVDSSWYFMRFAAHKAVHLEELDVSAKYNVEFDPAKLIERCADSIKKNIIVGKTKFDYKKGLTEITKGGVSVAEKIQATYTYDAKDSPINP